MKYSAIKTCDVHNGTGLRVSLWTQGCKGYCGDKCQNKETWDLSKGKEFTENEFNILVQQINKGMNLSIVGGEPLEDYNIKDLTEILQRLKNIFPNLNIWLWTHFRWDEIKHLELIKYLDVVVDGKYLDDLNCDYRLTLVDNDRWRGSSNQFIIDVKASLFQGKQIEYNS